MPRINQVCQEGEPTVFSGNTNRNQNVVPTAGSLLTPHDPWCKSMIDLTMASPSPVLQEMAFSRVESAR
jgi:hypothetical protein